MIFFDPKKLKDITEEEGFSTGLLKVQQTVGGHLIPENTRCYYFEGLNRVFEAIDKHYPNPANEGSSSTIGTNGGGFTLATETFEEAMNLFRKEPYKLVNLDDYQKKITEQSSRGNNIDYDIVGDFLDVSRYLEGIPEAFGSNADGKAEVQFVEIVVNIGWAWSTSREHIMEMNRELTSLVQWLEDNNVRCSIKTLEIGTCNSCEIHLKQFNDRLNIADLAVVTHNDFFRRIGFRLIEHSPTWGWGYGSSRPAQNFLAMYQRAEGNYSCIVIGQSVWNAKQDFEQLRIALVSDLSQRKLATYRICQ